ncbi:hypothetical protein [Sinomonas cellulolyticus]|uniref:hypothetical protein n=2 Tax=Sinomonas cellulolyticus TaxID=2801916 RepID=UPI001F203EAD|nr:hypothetical protein [Sinomonas cellulolyticus]
MAMLDMDELVHERTPSLDRVQTLIEQDPRPTVSQPGQAVGKEREERTDVRRQRVQHPPCAVHEASLSTLSDKIEDIFEA